MAALLLEAAFGYPDRLYRRIRHPVVWIGALIAVLERAGNRPVLPAILRRLAGVFALTLLLAVVTGVALALRWAAWRVLPAGLALLALGLLASSLIAQRSLYTHVRDVAVALEAGGVEAGRLAVSRIVGRDPASLDAAAVARAAIESLAENFADGVAAPLFWAALLGLPGIVAYKAINTADSMIGHRTPRHAAYGWAAARLDDAVNLPAARLAALWLAFAAPRRTGIALRTVWRYARRHRSPNAGWPEAAMAGALGLRLAGPRRYGGTVVEDAWMGDGRAEADAADLRRALRLYRRACVIQAAALLVLALAA